MFVGGCWLLSCEKIITITDIQSPCFKGISNVQQGHIFLNSWVSSGIDDSVFLKRVNNAQDSYKAKNTLILFISWIFQLVTDYKSLVVLRLSAGSLKQPNKSVLCRTNNNFEFFLLFFSLFLYFVLGFGFHCYFSWQGFLYVTLESILEIAL